jgi:hypothetical protein
MLKQERNLNRRQHCFAAAIPFTVILLVWLEALQGTAAAYPSRSVLWSVDANVSNWIRRFIAFMIMEEESTPTNQNGRFLLL